MIIIMCRTYGAKLFCILSHALTHMVSDMTLRWSCYYY